MSNDLMSKARFYLTCEPWHVSADGLYLYQESPNDPRQLTCWHIKGEFITKTGRAIKQDYTIDKPENFEEAGRYLIPINRLLFETHTPGGERIYISLEQIDPPGNTVAFKVSPLSMEQAGDEVRYELPPEIRQILWRLSEKRQQTFEEMVEALRRNKETFAPRERKAVINADPCWQSLENVSRAIVKQLGASLINKSGNNLIHFRNPSWVFQLHRVLAEGRIKGHRHLPGVPDPDYITHCDSCTHWKEALEEAGDDWTWDNNHEQLQDNAPKAYRAIRIMAPWFRLGTLLDEAFDWVIPGHNEKEEYCWLRMHYAHFYCDLVWAMKKYGKGREEADWRIIYEIIMNSFITPSADLGQAFLSMLLRFVEALLDDNDDSISASAAEVADLNTHIRHLMVDSIITDLKGLA
jgi:hypothetical protein